MTNLDLVKYYYDTLDVKRGDRSFRSFLMTECNFTDIEVVYFRRFRNKGNLPFANLLTKTLHIFSDDKSVEILESSMRTNEKLSPQAEEAYENYYKENLHLVPTRRKIRKAYREFIIAEALRNDSVN